MSRYIDADKLIENLEHGSIVIDEKVFECETIHDELVYLLDKVSDFVSKVVRELSTADVVEVVRCPECKLHNFCATEDIFLFSGISDGYCRVGKRKGNNEI